MIFLFCENVHLSFVCDVSDLTVFSNLFSRLNLDITFCNDKTLVLSIQVFHTFKNSIIEKPVYIILIF